MATQQGWRIALRPDFTSVNPAVEGDVVTAPGTTVTDPCWVWSEYRQLAIDSAFSGLRGPVDGGDGYDHYARTPLLCVEWDDSDVLESVPTNPGHRYLVSACVVGDELTIQEAAGLAVQADENPGRDFRPLWHAGDSVGFGATDASPGYYDGVDGAFVQSGRRIFAANGTTFPATAGSEVGWTESRRYPYGYVAILAAHGR